MSYVPLSENNFLDSTTTTDVGVDTDSYSNKVSNLNSKREDKINRISPKTRSNNVINSIPNDYNPAEIQFILSDVMQTKQLNEDRTRFMYGDGEAYEGPTGMLYAFGTNRIDQPENPSLRDIKIGYAGSHWNAAENRYVNDKKGYAPGPEGVDVNNKLYEAWFPEHTARATEAMLNGNATAISQKVAPYNPETAEADKARFGSGRTEILARRADYSGVLGDASMWGELTEERKNQLRSDFAEFERKVENSMYVQTPEDSVDSVDRSNPLKLLSAAMLKRESNNNYKAKNRLNYVGGYQFGAQALEDLGYLKSGAYATESNKSVFNNNQWSGKDGISSLNDFFNSPEVQDKAFEELATLNLKRLKNNGVITENTSDEEILGYLAAAHLLGAGGVKKGLDGTDANNTSGRSYFNIGVNAYNGIGISNNTSDMSFEELTAYYKEKFDREDAADMDFGDRAYNTIATLGKSFAKEVFVDSLDWVGESLNKVTGGTVGFDLGTEEEKNNYLNNFYGVNKYVAEKEYEKAGQLASKIYDDIVASDKEVSLSDMYELVKIGATTPELAAESLGFFLSMVVPIGWGGKAAKADKAVGFVDAAVKAGKLSKAAGKAKKLEIMSAVTTFDKTKEFMRSNGSFMQVSAGNVNDQIDAYIEEHGEPPSMAKVASMYVTETLMMSLDKFSGTSILKSPLSFKGVKDAFSAIDVGDKAKVMFKAVNTAFTLTAKHGVEAGQEYLQEIGQEFNVKFNFDDNGDFESVVDEAGKVLLSRDMQIVGITGAGLGAGGAMQFSAVGAVGTAVKGAKALTSRSKVIVDNSNTVNKSTVDTNTPTDNVVADSDAKAAYATKLTGLAREINEKGVTSENIGKFLDDIDEINDTKHVIKTSSKESQAKGEAVYNSILDKVEEFVRNNQDLVLTKRVIRKTVKESSETNDLKPVIDSLPETSHASMLSFASATKGDDVNDLTTAYKIVKNNFKKNSVEEAFEEVDTVTPYLQELELGLAGSVSDDINTTYNNIKQLINNTNTTSSSANQTSTVLGSSDSAIEEEFEDYDDFTRAAEAERLANVLLGSGRTYDEDFQDKLIKFAVNNGVNETRINDLVKNYVSVEQEATVGDTGYKTRLSRLRSLMASSNPRKNLIAKETDRIISMQSALERSVEALKAGVKEAETAAADFNRQGNKLLRDKALSVVTGYMKYNKKTGKYDVPYDITVSKDKKTGKWKAYTDDAKNLIAIKSGYVSEITKEVVTISRQANKKNPGVMASFAEYTIPNLTGKLAEAAARDKGLIKKVENLLTSLNLPSTVTKVILGNTTTSKWKKSSDYSRANSAITNSEEISNEDVVIINSTGTKKSKEGKVFSDILYSNNADVDTLSESASSFKAAVDSGATIVLDREMSMDANKGSRDSIVTFLTRYKGYVLVDGYNGSLLVKANDDIKSKLEELKDKQTKEKDKEKNEKAIKAEVVSLSRALDVGVHPKSGDTLTEATRAELEEQLEKTTADALEFFNGDSVKLNSYIERVSKIEVKKEVDAIIADPNPKPANYKDKAFEKAVVSQVETAVDKDVKVNELIKEWKDAVEKEELEGKSLEEKVKQLLSKIASTPRSIIKDILSTARSLSTGKNDVYELVYTSVKDNKPYVKMVRSLPSKELLEKYTKEGQVIKNKKYVLVDVRRVVQDVSKLVDVNKSTLINSVPVELLPKNILDNVNKFYNVVSKVLKNVEEAELSEQTDDKNGNSFKAGNYNLYNSPARGIIFNNEGKPNKEVIAAMYLAIGDLLSTDIKKLTRGYKTDADIANMFNIQEAEVTKKMRTFANDNGSFAVTVSSNVGKSVLKQLGLNKKSGSDISSGEYEVLVADIGQSALLLAEKLGLVEFTSVKSNEIASLYRDGKKLESDSDTYLVHVKDTDKTNGKFVNKVPANNVVAFTESFDNVIDALPEVQTRKKGPHFSKPSNARVERALSEVRNDIVNLTIPKEARKVLKVLMNTGHSFELARVNKFLDMVDSDDYDIKGLLGYVDEDSEKFNNLLLEDKKPQIAKNDVIENSIKELRKLRDQVVERGEDNTTLFFDYFYASNHRYMLDSNTVNPQTDKMIRFLLSPEEHLMDYEVTKGKNGGLLFKTINSKGKVSDQSYMVRMALSQAFGKSVDKLDPQSIISFGDALLGMSSDMINKAEKALLTKGKYIIEDTEGVQHELEAEHVTHTLQGLDFLRSVKSSNKFTSSLSLEFDSLTSGFANKVQQMPLLKNMSMHLARVGVYTEEFLEYIKNEKAYKGEGETFDPSKGHSAADVLHAGSKIGFYDSYQNLVKTVVDMLSSSVDRHKHLSDRVIKGKGVSGISLFETLKPLMPGGNYMEEGVLLDKISGPLRNMFKNPFMIFNYSAGINRIVINLSDNAAHDILANIATVDLSSKEGAAIKTVVEELLASVDVKNPEDGKVIKKAKVLQKVLRTYEPNRLKIDNMLVGTIDKKEYHANNLSTLLTSLVSLTYGVAVRQAFEKEFEAFIEVQDSMNDLFKVAFRIFDKKRVDLLSKIRLSKDVPIITVEDQAKVLEQLWDDFPWIVGPLTGSNNKSDVVKDVIAIATTTTRVPNSVELARVSAQTRIVKDTYGTDTRTVNPIVRYLEEAANAGSVLPFHALDGAEVAYVLSNLFDANGTKGILAIHDAVIPPIDQADEASFTYQKGMFEYNSGKYTLSGVMQDLVDRVSKTVKSDDFSKEYSEVKHEGIKTAEKDDTFIAVAKKAVGNMQRNIDLINKAREEYYGENGKLKGAWYGNLIATGGGMFREGMVEPDLSYKDELAKLYREVTIKDDSKQSDSVDVINTSSLPKVLENKVKTLLKDVENVYTAIELLEELSNDKSKSAKVRKLIKALIKDVEDNISKEDSSYQLTEEAKEEIDLDKLIDETNKECK